MSEHVPDPTTRWQRVTPASVAEIFANVPARWWLSAGSAFDQWSATPLRDRDRLIVSTTLASIDHLIAGLPAGRSAWVVAGDDVVAWSDIDEHGDVLTVLIYDVGVDAWILQVNLEDGTPDRWVYRRDPRLQLPWDQAVLDIDGIPTGAPEVQLVWKALRPKPEDEADKDIILPALSESARSWWERAILSVHPHSTWSIHVRSPFAPGKASWNRLGR